MNELQELVGQVKTTFENTAEFKEFKEIVEKVKADGPTAELFNKLRKAQQEVNSKGPDEEIDPELMATLSTLGQEITNYPLLLELMQAEEKMNALIQNLTTVMFEPVASVYGDIEE